MPTALLLLSMLGCGIVRRSTGVLGPPSRGAGGIHHHCPPEPPEVFCGIVCTLEFALVPRFKRPYVVPVNDTVSYGRRVSHRRAWLDFCAHNRHLLHGNREHPPPVPYFHILTGKSFLPMQAICSSDLQRCIRKHIDTVMLPAGQYTRKDAGRLITRATVMTAPRIYRRSLRLRASTHLVHSPCHPDSRRR